MAYDPELAERVREVLAARADVVEKRMFGGLAFLVDGHMAVCAASEGRLMVRVDPTESESLLADPAAERMVMRGKELDGWLLVRADDDGHLTRWVGVGLDYVARLSR